MKKKFLSVMLAVMLMLEPVGITATAEENQDNDELQIVSMESGATTDGEDSLFPGLPEGYVLSEEQLAAKSVLAEHVKDITEMTSVETSADTESGIDSDSYAEGELVYLTDSAEEAQLVADAFGGTLDSYGLGVAVIRLAENRTVTQAVSAAADDTMLLPAVWPNYYKELYDVSDDPLGREDFYGEWQWYHEFLATDTAWRSFYTGEGVKIALLDSGVTVTDEEFADRIVKQLDLTTGTPVESATDAWGHGTRMAHVIAGNRDNKKGGVGIAPEAFLYVYNVCSEREYVTSDAAIRGINQAIADGVDIINMSYGSYEYDANEENAIRSAYEAGIAVFAAAGNDSANTINYPAAYDSVCAITGLKSDGSKASSANYHESVDLAFPGADIYLPCVNAHNGNTYTDKFDGTSYSCAIASGVAAAILSRSNELPEFNGKSGAEMVDVLYDVMKKNARKSPSKGTGAGYTYLPDVFDLHVEGNDVAPAKLKFGAPSGTVFTSPRVTLKIYSTDVITFDGEGISIYYSLDGKTPYLKNGEVINGILDDGNGILIGDAKTVTVKAIAVNLVTGMSSEVTTATYTFKPNPSVEIIVPGNVTTIARGSSLSLKAQKTPSYAVPCKVNWEVFPAGQGVTVSSSGKVKVAKDAVAANYKICATAMDTMGNVFSEDTRDFVVSPVQADTTEVILANKNLKLDILGSYELREDVTTKHKGGLVKVGTDTNVTFTNSNPDVIYMGEGGLLIPRKAGKAKITVTANDGSKKKAICTVTVTRQITDISLDENAVVAPGKSITMKASIYPKDLPQKNIKWSIVSYSEDFAGKVTLKKGKITASKDAHGEVQIQVSVETANGVCSAYSTVKITETPVQKITMDKTLELVIPDVPTGIDRTAVDAEIAGSDIYHVRFYSANPNVATVDRHGVVQAQAAGKTTIYCESIDGTKKKASCKVTVKIPPSSIQIIPADDSEGRVCAGSSIKLKALLGSSHGIPTDQKINWSVLPKYKDIISVSKNGVVKAKAANDGTTATVQAEVDGLYAYYEVTVYPTLKSFKLASYGYCLYVQHTLHNGMRLIELPCSVTVTAPKGKNVCVENDGDYIYLDTDQATTTKEGLDSDSATKKDGIRVKVKVKAKGSNKSATTTVYLVKTVEGNVFLIQ